MLNGKKLLAVTVTTGLLLAYPIYVFASGQNTAVTAQPGATTSQQQAAKGTDEARVLSLEEAMQLAMQNNYQIKLEAQKKKQAEINLSEAHDTAKRLDKLYNDNGMDVNTALGRYVSEKEKQISLDNADRSYQIAVERIKLQIRQEYLGLLQREDAVNAYQVALNRAKEQLKNAQAAYKVGTIAKNELLAAEAMMNKAQADLLGARTEYDIARMSLCKDLGLDISTNIKLQRVNNLLSSETVNLDQMLEKALSERLDLKMAIDAIKLAQENYEVTKKYTAPNTYMSKRAEVNIEMAKITADNTRQGVLLEVTSNYNKMQTAAEKYKALDSVSKSQAESYRLSQMRFKVGVATALDVNASLEQLTNAELARIQAQYAYEMARESFLASLKVPLQ